LNGKEQFADHAGSWWSPTAGSRVTGSSASVPTEAEVIDLGNASAASGVHRRHTHLTMMYSEELREGSLDPCENHFQKWRWTQASTLDYG